MREMLLRFVIGGAIVSFFAVLAEIFRPKSFAGLFNAAPSVALATLGITIVRHGKNYAAAEAHTMLFGAAGFLIYAAACCWVLMRWRPKALIATAALIPIWFGVSFALWWGLGR